MLVFSVKAETAFIYAVTSQYEDKSEAVRARYFKISDWRQAGLDKQSYVDTSTYFSVPTSTFTNQPIGRLTAEDKERLISFLNKGR